MTNRRRWVVLSPHLDDAVLSCGGLIAALRNKDRVEIWTLFSAAPYRGPYSPAAHWLHGVSGGATGSRLAAQRRREDRAAAKLLGAKVRHFPWHDAVYRKSADNSFLYSDTRLPRWQSDDSSLISEMSATLRERLSNGDVLLLPLAVGGHVDHQIVRRAGDDANHNPIFYYADTPYAQIHPAELKSRTTALRRIRYGIGARDLRDWKDAIQRYESQMPMLAAVAGNLAELIERHAVTYGLALYSSTGTATLPSALLSLRDLKVTVE